LTPSLALKGWKPFFGFCGQGKAIRQDQNFTSVFLEHSRVLNMNVPQAAEAATLILTKCKAHSEQHEIKTLAGMTVKRRYS